MTAATFKAALGPERDSVQARRIEAIHAFAADGRALIPLNGKKPQADGWEATRPGQYTPELLAVGNYGVVLRATDLVIDVDPRNFESFDDPVKRLSDKVGGLPESFKVRSGGGGFHLYLTKPVDLLVRNSLKDFPGIEFKAAGRQLVGPGSIHPDTGREYAVEHGFPETALPAPQALLDLIKRTIVPFDEVGTGAYVNDAATQGRYLAYLQDIAPTSGSYAVACKGRDLGLAPGVTWELMVEVWNKRRTIPRSAEELRVRIVHAYTYARGAVGSAHPATDFKGLDIPTPDATVVEEPSKRPKFRNLIKFLSFPPAGLAGVFGLNEFTGRHEFTRPAPWHKGRMPASVNVSDNDLKLLKGHLAMRHGFEMSVGAIEEAVTNVAHENRFHPVREYLESLTWDGTPRARLWLSTFLGVEDSEYTRACAVKFLCAAVMRVFRPGVKFDHVLVFEGLQGIGKSSVCKILAGEWGADFTIDPLNKDSIQQMQGKWIIELAEMETPRRADRQAMKAFITRSKDEARLAYGRTVGEFPRQSVFIGTINPGADGTYLEDEENRRWWPVRCDPKGPNGKVDFRAFKDARNQLWAEAVHIVKTTKETLHMDSEKLEAAAKAVVGERHAEHPWTERIAGWLHERDKKEETRAEFLTSREVYVDAMGGIDKQLDRRAQLAIATVLKALGWVSGHKRLDGRFTRGFVRAADKIKDPFLKPVFLNNPAPIETPVLLDQNHLDILGKML